MDSTHYNKIRRLSDLKVEKARLRYEMAVIENRINNNIEGIRDLASLPSFLSRITYGFEVAQTVYSRISKIISKFSSWRSKRKQKKH